MTRRVSEAAYSGGLSSLGKGRQRALERATEGSEKPPAAREETVLGGLEAEGTDDQPRGARD